MHEDGGKVHQRRRSKGIRKNKRDMAIELQERPSNTIHAAPSPSHERERVIFLRRSLTKGEVDKLEFHCAGPIVDQIPPRHVESHGRTRVYRRGWALAELCKPRAFYEEL